jgi:predicted amidophosphoribosyltransferase
VVLPFAYLTLPLLAPPTIWLLLWSRRWTHRRCLRLGRCATCGYDLRATPVRCPECGAMTTEAEKG